MKTITVTGWVALTKNGTVAKAHTKPHPEVKSGFPCVYKLPDSVPPNLQAARVRVTVERLEALEAK